MVYLSQIGYQQMTNRSTASGFSKDCNLIWVTTKMMNIFFDPSKTHNLIKKSHITHRVVRIKAHET